MTDRQGGCLCGAVRFEATDVPATAGICHCEMCRRWTGSALIAVAIETSKITWHGGQDIRHAQTSDWARRAWCDRCGSCLYFEVTMDSPYKGTTDLPIGLFDDPNGFTLSHEIWIDHKPDSYAYAGDGRKTLTRQQCVDKFEALGT